MERTGGSYYNEVEGIIEIVFKPHKEEYIQPKENIFIKDVNEIKFVPDIVKNKAVNIYTTVLGSISFREENRRALIALLLYYGYCSLSMHIDIYFLAEKMGFSDLRKINEIRKKIGKIYEFEIPQFFSEPEDYIREINEKIEVDIIYLVPLIQRIRAVHPTFSEIIPREVAIGIILQFESENFDLISEHIPLLKSKDIKRIEKRFFTTLWPVISPTC